MDEQTYVVELATNPAPGLTFYRGEVRVVVEPEAVEALGEQEAAFRAAVRELRRTSFPDRGLNCWRFAGFRRAK